MSELNGHLDEVIVGDSPVPGGRERLDQLAFDCRMSMDYMYLQGYFTPEILNRNPILQYVIGRARSASWCCSGTSSCWPVWQDDMAHCHPLNRTNRPSGKELRMLIAPRTSAVYQCIWSHWQFHRQCPTSLRAMQHQIMIFRRCFTVRFRLSGLNSSPGNLLTYVWA